MRLLIYEPELHPNIKKDLKKIDRQFLSAIKEDHIKNKLLIDPYIGEPLTGNLSGIWSYHLKLNKTEYRIANSIFEEKKQIYIYMVSKRENFYRDLKSRLG